MPPKTCKCVTCGEEVLKSQTLEVSTGMRACRSHESTQSASEHNLKVAKEIEARRVKDAEAKRRRWMSPDPEGPSKFMQEMMEFRQWADTHCWTCGDEGISLQEYFLNVLVANKRLELRGEFNFLTMGQDARREMGNPTVLSVLPYHHETDYQILRMVVKDRLKTILPLLGQVQMCGHCIPKYHVQDRLEALLPHPTMEQIEAVMPLVALMDPVLTELAQEQGGT